MRTTHYYRGNFNGAAIIDEAGKEIPITEEMVRAACEHLEKAWQFPSNTTKTARRTTPPQLAAL